MLRVVFEHAFPSARLQVTLNAQTVHALLNFRVSYVEALHAADGTPTVVGGVSGSGPDEDARVAELVLVFALTRVFQNLVAETRQMHVWERSTIRYKSFYQ